MSLQSKPIDLLGVVDLIAKRWFFILGVPALLAVLLYFLLPVPPVSYTASAILATNGLPSVSLVDKALSQAQREDVEIVLEQDSVKITASSGLTSEEEGKALLGLVMAPFMAAARLDGPDRNAAQAAKDRIDGEITVLNDALEVLRSSPPSTTSEGYNPSTYADSILALSARLSELAASQFDLDRQLSLPLPVSGIIRYNVVEHRSSPRLVLIVVAALAAGLLTLLWMVALEALRRRDPSPGT